MTYIYKCVTCNEITEVTKPMKDASKVEHCKKCKEPMNRVFDVSGIKTGDGVK